MLIHIAKDYAEVSGEAAELARGEVDADWPRPCGCDAGLGPFRPEASRSPHLVLARQPRRHGQPDLPAGAREEDLFPDKRRRHADRPALTPTDLSSGGGTCGRAAVDPEHLAGHIACPGRAQPGDDVGDLLRLADSAERDVAGTPLSPFAGETLGVSFGPHDAWSDGVHPDAERTELNRQLPGEASTPAFEDGYTP